MLLLTSFSACVTVSTGISIRQVGGYAEVAMLIGVKTSARRVNHILKILDDHSMTTFTVPFGHSLLPSQTQNIVCLPDLQETRNLRRSPGACGRTAVNGNSDVLPR
jgi:alkylated DNA nucleotide flippase Atl1